SIAIGKMLDQSGYLQDLRDERSEEADGRVENLAELVSAAREYEGREPEPTLNGFVDRLSLLSDADEEAGTRDARVWMMTLHSAKGLEFPVVILAGLEEGLFPHSRSRDDEEELEEERRLCYVGMTRAMRQLILTRALRRRSYGEDYLRGTRCSRFLDEIPPDLMESVRPEAPLFKTAAAWDGALNSVESVEQFLERRGDAATQASGPPSVPSMRSSSHSGGNSPQWKLGARVRHPKYGFGTIVEREGEGGDLKLTVSFPGYGRKKLIERYASLERA
ncbi:MAG: 3'-5' exonuclease, partial [Terriglobia bacterium]